jgi:hypothetical protein
LNDYGEEISNLGSNCFLYDNECYKVPNSDNPTNITSNDLCQLSVSRYSSSSLTRPILFRILLGALNMLSVLHNKKINDNMITKHLYQVGQFLEVVRIIDAKDDICLDLLPDVNIPIYKDFPSPAHWKLYQQLQKDLSKKGKEDGNKYEIINEYEGIRGGLFPVDITIKKNDKIIGFIEVDGSYHYRIDKETGKKKLRRVDQLKEFLYRHHYPNVSFTRIAETITNINIAQLSRECISKIN